MIETIVVMIAIIILLRIIVFELGGLEYVFVLKEIKREMGSFYVAARHESYARVESNTTPYYFSVNLRDNTMSVHRKTNLMGGSEIVISSIITSSIFVSLKYYNPIKKEVLQIIEDY